MNGLSEKTISQLHRVFESYKEIDQVLIYGSRAKGDFRPGSAIDLTLRGSNLTHNLMLEIGNQIDDLLLPSFALQGRFISLCHPLSRC